MRKDEKETSTMKTNRQVHLSNQHMPTDLLQDQSP